MVKNCLGGRKKGTVEVTAALSLPTFPFLLLFSRESDLMRLEGRRRREKRTVQKSRKKEKKVQGLFLKKTLKSRQEHTERIRNLFDI